MNYIFREMSKVEFAEFDNQLLDVFLEDHHSPEEYRSEKVKEMIQYVEIKPIDLHEDMVNMTLCCSQRLRKQSNIYLYNSL